MSQFIYGKGCAYAKNPHITQLNNNALVVGPSGSGKTMSIVEPCLLSLNSTSAIVALSKRKLADTYSGYFKDKGYDFVEELDFSHPETSPVGYDSLRYVKTDAQLQQLAEAIVINNPSAHNDVFWDNNARDLLVAIMAYVRAVYPCPSMTHVIQTLENLRLIRETYTSLDDDMHVLASLDNHSYDAKWRAFHDLAYKTQTCVLTSLMSYVGTMFNADIMKMMSLPNQLDLHALGEKRGVVFLITKASSANMQKFVNIFYSQLFDILFDDAQARPDGALKVPVHVFCDDFAVGSRIKDFEQHISAFRAAGLSTTLLLQSESQLFSMYGPDNATTIINNCDTYVYMGGNDIRTCQSLSQRLNQPLDVLMNLAVGKVWVMRRGQKPKLTTRYPITHDPAWQALRHPEHSHDERLL